MEKTDARNQRIGYPFRDQTCKPGSVPPLPAIAAIYLDACLQSRQHCFGK